MHTTMCLTSRIEPVPARAGIAIARSMRPGNIDPAAPARRRNCRRDVFAITILVAGIVQISQQLYKPMAGERAAGQNNRMWELTWLRRQDEALAAVTALASELPEHRDVLYLQAVNLR